MKSFFILGTVWYCHFSLFVLRDQSDSVEFVAGWCVFDIVVVIVCRHCRCRYCCCWRRRTNKMTRKWNIQPIRGRERAILTFSFLFVTILTTEMCMYEYIQCAHPHRLSYTLNLLTKFKSSNFITECRLSILSCWASAVTHAHKQREQEQEEYTTLFFYHHIQSQVVKLYDIVFFSLLMIDCNAFALLIELFSFHFVYFPILGGNQRDLARAKNQKKLQDQKKGARTDGLTVEQRKQRFVASDFEFHNIYINLGVDHRNTILILNSTSESIGFSEMRNWYERNNRKRLRRPVEQLVENPKRVNHSKQIKSMKYQNSSISIENKIQFNSLKCWSSLLFIPFTMK